MLLKYNVFLLCGLSFIMFSCSPKNTEWVDKREKVKDNVLEHIVDSLHNQTAKYFYSKIGTEYQDSSRKVSFKTSVRMIQDSLINSLITYANIPIVNALISPDTIKVSNKRDKCYVNQSLSYFKKEFGVEFTQKNLEELFMGLPIGFNPSEKYYQVNSETGYMITTHRKKDIRKNEKKDIKEIITSYIIGDDLKELTGIIIESPDDSTTIVLHYISRELVDGLMMPKDVKVNIFTPKQELKIELSYNKTRLNEDETIHFVIPEDYEECE